MKEMNWTDDLTKKDSPVYKKTATDYCEGVSSFLQYIHLRK